MSGKVERSIGRDHQMVQHKAPKEQSTNGGSGWNILKIVGTGVGFLAAAQGMSVASARPVALTRALTAPRGGVFSNHANSSEIYSPPFLSFDKEVAANSYDQKTRKLLDNKGATYVTNDCRYTLIGTMEYFEFINTDKSKFIDRTIAPYTIAHDSYSNEPSVFGSSPHIEVTLRIDSAKQGNTVTVKADQSVVAKNIPNVDGCNIYHATYRTHHQTDGYPLLQIYANT